MFTLFDAFTATHNRSHILSSPSFSNDSEAAANQLLAEANSPVRRQSAAVIGANLLNAARMLPKSPAMALPVRDGKTEKTGKLGKPGKLGKLKRASLHQDRQRKVRSANVYDLNLSPQKELSLSAQISAAGLEARGQLPVAEEVEDVVLETSQVQQWEDRPIDASEDSDTLAPGQDQMEECKLEDISLPPQELHREEVSPAQHVSTGQLKRKDTVSMIKKRKRLGGCKAHSQDAAHSEDDLIPPSPAIQQSAQPRSRPQPQVRISVRAKRSRAVQAEVEKVKDTPRSPIVAATRGSKKKSNPQPRRTKSSRKAAPKPAKRKAIRKTASEEGEISMPETVKNKSHPTRTQLQAVKSRVESDIGDGGDDDDGNGNVGDDNEVKGNYEVVESGGEQQAQEKHAGAEYADLAATQIPNGPLGEGTVPEDSLEKVFNFLNLEERSGDCSTDLGSKIRRTCDRSCIALSQTGDGTSLQDVTQCKDDLIELLRSIGTTVRGNERGYFKSDAFGYLFRSLALVLEAMHGRLQEKEGNVTNSWVALQILFPYVNEILIFKDVMDTWKVKVSQSRKGDRLIKGVESDLIVPLRAVEGKFRRRWGQLRADERNLQDFIDRQRKRQEADEERVRREEDRKVRRKRWQDLHIIRMQCEPDPVRRQRLRFTEPQAIIEKDADGNEFERLSVFGSRSMPPPQRSACTSEREWTSEQETVLIDALQSSTRMRTQPIMLTIANGASQGWKEFSKPIAVLVVRCAISLSQSLQLRWPGCDPGGRSYPKNMDGRFQNGS